MSKARIPGGLTVKEQIAQSSEHDEQVALFRWAALKTVEYPELGLLFAIPNGGKRDPVTAAKLVREGVKRGVPDTCLPVPRKGWNGLFIELKWGYGETSEYQDKWLEDLNGQGFLAVVAVGWQEAVEVIKDYLGIESD